MLGTNHIIAQRPSPALSIFLVNYSVQHVMAIMIKKRLKIEIEVPVRSSARHTHQPGVIVTEQKFASKELRLYRTLRALYICIY
jgi:hypothetical protein